MLRAAPANQGGRITVGGGGGCEHELHVRLRASQPADEKRCQQKVRTLGGFARRRRRRRRLFTLSAAPSLTLLQEAGCCCWRRESSASRNKAARICANRGDGADAALEQPRSRRDDDDETSHLFFSSREFAGRARGSSGEFSLSLPSSLVARETCVMQESQRGHFCAGRSSRRRRRRRCGVITDSPAPAS